MEKTIITLLLQFFGNLSIRKKFSILMIITVFIIINIIGITSYLVSERILEETTLKSTTTLIKLASNELKTNFSKIEEISVLLLSNFDIQLMVQGKLTANEKLRLSDKIYNTMNTYVMSNGMIDSIAVYSINDSSLLFAPQQEKYTKQKDFIDYIQSSAHEDMISLKGKPVWIRINKEKEIVSLLRVINILGTQKKAGIICINIKESIFNSISDTLNISHKGAFFIMDKNKTLVYSRFSDKSLLEYSQETSIDRTNRFVNINRRDYYQVVGEFPLPEWNINVYIPSSEIFVSSMIIKTSIFGTVIVAIFIMVIMVLIISDFITRPIYKLGKMMYEVKKGDFSKRFDVKYNDEIGFLGNSFNSMIEQIQRYIEEIYDSYQKIKKSELDTLQTKINPHFLYNNLNTINWMAQDIKADNIEVYSRALSNYYRLSLSKGNSIITIKEEIEQLKNYIIIQKIRYEDLISFICDIDDDIENCMIVKLSLQPVLENAIFHGIEGKDGQGEITIKGKISDSDNVIIFEVIDNGIGMTEDKLKELRENLEKNESIGTGYGLRNVNERIKLYFGKNYGLRISSEYNKGTKVMIIIPIREGNDNCDQSVNS